VIQSLSPHLVTVIAIILLLSQNADDGFRVFTGPNCIALAAARRQAGQLGYQVRSKVDSLCSVEVLMRAIVTCFKAAESWRTDRSPGRGIHWLALNCKASSVWDLYMAESI
jgi:hypothetical protein